MEMGDVEELLSACAALPPADVLDDEEERLQARLDEEQMRARGGAWGERLLWWRSRRRDPLCKRWGWKSVKNGGMNDPDVITSQEFKVLAAVSRSSDPREIARWSSGNHRADQRDRRVNKTLYRLEGRRLVTQRGGRWFLAPPGPWRLSAAEFSHRSALRRKVSS